MLVVQHPHRLRQVKRRRHGAPRMVGPVEWRAPERHDAITHVFVDGAAVAANHVREPAQYAVEKGLHGDRLKALGQLREAADVAEQDRQVLADGLHPVMSRVADHLPHEFRWHIHTEQAS